MAATEEGLHEHLSKTKVPLRILVRARRGEAFATAVGNATIGLDKLAAYVSGTPGSGSKTSIMIPIEIPPLGSMVIRMSMGLSCLASMEDDSTFVDEHLSVTRSINTKVSVSKNVKLFKILRSCFEKNISIVNLTSNFFFVSFFVFFVSLFVSLFSSLPKQILQGWCFLVSGGSF